MFRQYEEYGYITDNSEFGYTFLNDNKLYPGEKFVSASGAVMLSMLNKTPRHIDHIIAQLMKIFIGVSYEELKKDTIEFFQWLADEGYLNSGETAEECQSPHDKDNTDFLGADTVRPTINTESCDNGLISQNDFLRSIHFDITSMCNERCIHCYIPHECKTKAIDSKLFYRILDEGRKDNIIHVTLSGGEPLLHKDILQFLAKCRELDLSVNVLSNLTMLTDEMISEMKRNPLLSVQASLYSMDPAIHDSITALNGSYEKTMQNLIKLYDADIPLQISCPIMKQNKDSFLGVIRWGKEHNIAVAIEPVIFASFDNSGSNLVNRLSLKELEKVLEIQLSEGYAELLSENAKAKEALDGENPVCSICRYSFCVSVEGHVFPCAGWQSNILGDLNYQSVHDVWTTSEKIRHLREVKRNAFPKCVSCEHRGYCTVCMMSNSNESPQGNAFCINEFHCKAAAIMHKKVKKYLSRG